MAAEQVRILRVEGRAVGMEVVTAGLDKVSAAAGRATRAGADLGIATEATDRKVLSMSRALEATQRRLDATYRTEQDVAKSQKVLNMGYEQGHISLSRLSELSALNNARLREGSDAAGKASRAAGLAGHEWRNLAMQANDAATMLASGSSLFQIAATQSGQVLQVLQGANGGVGGAFRSIGSSIVAAITPLRLLGVTAGVVGVAGAAMAVSWKRSELQFADVAKQAGTTLQAIHGLEAAASFKGIETTDFFVGMREFSSRVYEADRGLGSLAETFRANGVQAKGFENSLFKAADIIARMPTEQGKLNALQQMGLPATQEWVKLLGQGGVGLREAIGQAVKFGGAADEGMIARARRFDEEWNKATKNLSLGIRSAFVESVTWLEQLGSRATGALMKVVPNVPRNILRTAIEDNRGSRLDQSQANEFYNAVGIRERNQRPAIDPNILKAQLGLETQRIGILGNLASVADIVRAKEIDIATARLNGVRVTEREAEVLKRLAAEQALGLTGLKQQADAYSIEAEALGKSVGAATAYVAQQNLLAEARRNGRNLTEENVAAITREAEALGKAAQALAERNLSREISFERSQIGLSDTEQSINMRLRSVYGDELNSAQAQFYAGQLRVNEALRTTSEIGRDAFTGALQAIRDGKFEMTELTAILDRVAAKLIDMAAQGLWQSAFGGGGGSMFGGGGSGGGGFFGSLFGSMFGGGGGGGSSSLSMVTGGMGSDFPIPTFGAANGGEFGYGRGWGVVGERGPELINVHNAGVTVYSNPVSQRMARNLPGFADGGSMDLSGRIFPMPSPAANSNGITIAVDDHRTIQIGAGADPAVVSQVRALLEADKRGRAQEISQVVYELKSRGHIR